MLTWHATIASAALLPVLQGILDPNRRDYASAFAAVSHPAVLAQLRAHNESLLLLGHMSKTPIDIPPHLQPYVQIVSGLPYQVRAAAAAVPEVAAHQQQAATASRQWRYALVPRPHTLTPTSILTLSTHLTACRSFMTPCLAAEPCCPPLLPVRWCGLLILQVAPAGFYHASCLLALVP